MALTSLPQIKSFLHVPCTNTTQDEWLNSLRIAAEATVKSYINQQIETATYTEFYSGTGNKLLVLKERPVTSITSIYLDHEANFGFSTGAFNAATLLTSGTDYSLYLDNTYNGFAVSLSGIVTRIKTFWPETGRLFTPGKLTADVGPAFGNIKVTYVAGWSPVPADIQYAVAYIVAYMRRVITIGGPIISETIGDYRYLLGQLYTKVPELATARQILSRYREINL